MGTALFELLSIIEDNSVYFQNPKVDAYLTDAVERLTKKLKSDIEKKKVRIELSNRLSDKLFCLHRDKIHTWKGIGQLLGLSETAIHCYAYKKILPTIEKSKELLIRLEEAEEKLRLVLVRN